MVGLQLPLNKQEKKKKARKEGMLKLILYPIQSKPNDFSICLDLNLYSIHSLSNPVGLHPLRQMNNISSIISVQPITSKNQNHEQFSSFSDCYIVKPTFNMVHFVLGPIKSQSCQLGFRPADCPYAIRDPLSTIC